jgi:POT family proton-dependent oligopeptide transporter
VLTGIGEIFASITALEYAYTKAPSAMKSLVMAFFLLTNAFGSLLGIALAPTALDPKLVVTYSCLAVVTILTATIFWFCLRKYNKVEEALNEIEVKAPTGVARPPGDELATETKV